MLDRVNLRSNSANVINTTLGIGVLFIVRRTAIVLARRAIARFYMPEHRINCFPPLYKAANLHTPNRPGDRAFYDAELPGVSPTPRRPRRRRFKHHPHLPVAAS